MYLKGVPFFNGRLTQISTFSVKNGIQKDEGLNRGAEALRIKLWYVAPLGVKHDKNRGNFLLFTKPSSQNS